MEGMTVAIQSDGKIVVSRNSYMYEEMTPVFGELLDITAMDHSILHIWYYDGIVITELQLMHRVRPDQ